MTAQSRIPPSPYEIGVQALSQGRIADALHAFEQAYHLNPYDPALHEAIGKLYLEQGDYRRAREYLKYALYLSPSSASASCQLALVEQRDGHPEQAVELFRRVLEVEPDHELATKALEEERARARIARRLPTWQPARPFRKPIALRPPRQVGPDGRVRFAPLRAPHLCVNCYFRPGRARVRIYAARYNWWNLGLVAMLFAGWPVYLIWTYAVRERRFSFDPFYCATCAADRRLLGWTWGLLTPLGAIFGLAALITAASAQPLGAFDLETGMVVFWSALSLGCVLFAALAYRRARAHRGVRLSIGGPDEVMVQFTSAEYEKAFLELNQAFVSLA